MNEKTEKKNAWIQIPEDVSKPKVSISPNGNLIAFVEINYDLQANDPRREFDGWSEEELQAWENGDIFGYQIYVYYCKRTIKSQIFDIISDYRFDIPIIDDSCWGFYGYDWFLSNLQETIENFSISE